jgi:hypothetical protein
VVIADLVQSVVAHVLSVAIVLLAIQRLMVHASVAINPIANYIGSIVPIVSIDSILK